MKLTKISTFSGKEHTLEIPNLTQERYDHYLRIKNDRGVFIQNVFPDLSDDEREFIMTGVTAAEWNEAFGDEEEESMNDLSDDDKQRDPDDRAYKDEQDEEERQFNHEAGYE